MRLSVRPVASGSWSALWALTLAALGLGVAVQVRDGLYDPWAFVGLTVAIVGCMAFFLASPGGRPEEWRQQGAVGIFALAIAAEFLLHLMRARPGSSVGMVATPAWRGLMGVAVLLAAGVVLLPCYYRGTLAALVLVFLVQGAWIIRATPKPYTDVWVAQTQGLDALVHGKNPYAATFADLYHNQFVYAPGTIQNGRVQLGFPYPPLAALMDLPAYVLTGDFRYANLAAAALAALLIAFAVPGRLAPLAAVVFLFTPRVFLIVEHGFTEPSEAMLLALVVFCACRRPAALGVVLGLFLASKQYLIFAAVPAVLLLGESWTAARLWRTAATAAAVGLAVSLPLALWNWHAFIHSTVEVAAGAPFRSDALSYVSLLSNRLHVPVSARVASLTGLVAAAAAAWLALRRGPRTPAGYAAAVALIYFGFFAFNKFAFCNYYYFLVAALCCAAGTMVVATDTQITTKTRRHEEALSTSN